MSWYDDLAHGHDMLGHDEDGPFGPLRTARSDGLTGVDALVADMRAAGWKRPAATPEAPCKAK